MDKIKIQLTDEQIALFDNGNIFNDGNQLWYNIPSWFRRIEDTNIFEIVEVKYLPSSVREFIACEDLKNLDDFVHSKFNSKGGWKGLVSENHLAGFVEWVKTNSKAGLTEVLDFSKYNRFVDSWSITIDGKETVNPSIEFLYRSYLKKQSEPNIQLYSHEDQSIDGFIIEFQRLIPEDRTWTKAQSIFHYMQDKYMSKDFGFGFINEIAKLITKKDEKELFGYWNKYQNDRSRNR